jgi:hypothetical protein
MKLCSLNGLNQKWIRQQEEQKLEEERAMLYQERCSIEDQKRVLEAREAKLSEVKNLIPSAAELKSMGIEFIHAVAWINVIREYAAKKMVDERTATWRLAEDLKNWQELGGMENAISNAKNQGFIKYDIRRPKSSNRDISKLAENGHDRN